MYRRDKGVGGGEHVRPWNHPPRLKTAGGDETVERLERSPSRGTLSQVIRYAWFVAIPYMFP